MEGWIRRCGPAAADLARHPARHVRRAARARALAIWASANGLAMAIGPTLGGALVHAFGWRAIFWPVLSLAAGCALLTAASVPELRVESDAASTCHAAALLSRANALARTILEAPDDALRCTKDSFVTSPGGGFDEWFKVEHDRAFQEVLLPRMARRTGSGR